MGEHRFARMVRSPPRACRSTTDTTEVDAVSVTIADEEPSRRSVAKTVELGVRVSDIVGMPATDHVYVAVTDRVIVISSLHNIIANISVPRDPKRLILGADGEFLYVVHYNGVLSIIDTTDHTSMIVDANSPSVAEVVSPDGRRVYLAHRATSSERDSSWISVLDADGTMVARVPVENHATGMDLSPDGSRLYVATEWCNSYTQYYSGFVTVLDTSTLNVIDTIAVPPSPSTVTVGPDGSSIFVTHHDTNAITTIDLARRNVSSISMQDSPLAAAVTADGTQMYVTGLRSLTVIDITGELTAETIPVGELPRRLHFSEDGKRAYIPDFGNHAVAVLDTITHELITTVDIGGNPEAVALSSDGEHLHVADYWDGRLTTVSLASVIRGAEEA